MLNIGDLCLKLIGALTIPYEKNEAVEQIFYFCAKDSCLKTVPVWCNVRYPKLVLVDSSVTDDERAALVQLTIETQK